MREFNNDASWKNAFSSMFGAIKMQDCTPATVLETMQTMPRSVNPLVEIVIAARSRNIAADDDSVLDCLRKLYKEKKIEHRCVGEKDFFIRK